jgi:hypothetical protein
MQMVFLVLMKNMGKKNTIKNVILLPQMVHVITLVSLVQLLKLQE